MQKKKIAVIGAASGQLPLVRKAKEMGLHTICFAWEKGAVCKDECDEFYPISIFDTDDIVEVCRRLKVDGVVSTASEETALSAAIVAQRLGLNTTSPDVIRLVQDKSKVRELTQNIEGLSKPKVFNLKDGEIQFPCVVKPIKGSAKRGVVFCENENELASSIEYSKSAGQPVMAEEYIAGAEYSVETISYEGVHEIVQVTRKVTTGFPHFVELEHHQPAHLTEETKERLHKIISEILTAVGISDGASHVEIKIDGDKIYLIEINPRGGGDHISDTLVGLSTDCDYLRDMILVALDEYAPHSIENIGYSGILFLNNQNKRIEKYFDGPKEEWMYERFRDNDKLRDSISNYDRNGYIIYQSKRPIKL